MEKRKVVVKVEIDTDNFDFLKECLWELVFKIEDWYSAKEFVKKCRVTKYEEKNKH